MALSLADQRILEKLQAFAAKHVQDGAMTQFQADLIDATYKQKSSGLFRQMSSVSLAKQEDKVRTCPLEVLLPQQQAIWDELFSDCTTSEGKQISKSERASLGVSRADLVYGEVSFLSLGQILWGDLVKLKSGGVFYDLGSGTGRGVFAAALLHNFDKLVGIEILSGLHRASLTVHDKYKKTLLPDLSESQQKADVSFIRGSFLEHDWSDADVVFANSTCFEAKLMKQIALKGASLRNGTIVITLTKRLTAPHFQVLASPQYQMSWGYATVFIHQKVKAPTNPPQ